jgi:hypothetical protein
MNTERLSVILLAALCGSLIGSPVRSQTTKNKKVSDQKQEPPAKRKLKGAFKGQAIDTPQGQSLSDVVTAAQAAREQKEKDKADKTKPKPVVINNQDVKASRQATPKEPARPSAASAESAAAPAATAAPYRPTDLEGHDETFWRQKAQSSRERVERAREAVKTADEEARKQENDFYAWDDGQYRDNVIKPAWDRAKEELATAQKELAEAEEGLKNLEDDARKAGAMPGWIR